MATRSGQDDLADVDRPPVIGITATREPPTPLATPVRPHYDDRLKRTDDTSDLGAAAEALAAELARYEALAAGLLRERLDSEKQLRRAAQALTELERTEEQLGARVETLVGAINTAREGHAARAEAVGLRALEVRRRGEVLGGLVERWKLLGEAAAHVNALVKTL